MIPVILSGGSGSRLWPVSRSSYPKQFCDFFEESLMTKTLMRLKQWGNPYVVTVQSLSTLTEKCLVELDLPVSHVMYEPQPRNTAPAIALLCKQLMAQGVSDQEIVGIFPADHMVSKNEQFVKTVELAEECARDGQIVTIGISPSYPATGFGYVHCDDTELKTGESVSAYTVKAFCEKPNLSTAKEFLEAGNYYWNAGMFVFRICDMAAAFEQFLPEMWQVFSSTDDVKTIYDQVNEISLDYGIMEHAQNQVCVPSDIGWSDLGSWDDLSKALQKVSPESELIYEVDSSNNFVQPLKSKVVGLVGIEDLVIVDTEDALLVAKKGQTQKVKTIVENLKANAVSAGREHIFEYRPWGKYEILAEQDSFKSKIITVNPKSQLSYQSHEHRDELWMIIAGSGEVVLDDEIVPVKKDSFVQIPKQTKHRMRNTSDEPLQFVEIQTGSYFGEDDIKRYEDDYNRA